MLGYKAEETFKSVLAGSPLRDFPLGLTIRIEPPNAVITISFCSAGFQYS